MQVVPCGESEESVLSRAVAPCPTYRAEIHSVAESYVIGDLENLKRAQQIEDWDTSYRPSKLRPATIPPAEHSTRAASGKIHEES